MFFLFGLKVNGGAAYIVWDSDLVITSTSFVGNQAVQKGMAMFLARLSASSRVEFANVSFAHNAYHCPLGQYSFEDTDEVRAHHYFDRCRNDGGSSLLAETFVTVCMILLINTRYKLDYCWYHLNCAVYSVGIPGPCHCAVVISLKFQHSKEV